MTPDKQKIRDSIVTHLSTLQSYGLSHVMAPENLAEIEMQDPATHVDPALVVPEKAIFTEKDIAHCETLGDLHHTINGCTHCRLCEKRTNLVFGAGNPCADLMFVGEGPGHDEDIQGIPFVGAAGQLLTKIIEGMKFKREEVYIANIVKCRPPNNRNPQDDEINACLPILKKQIALIKPKVIMCLGKFAAQTLLNTQIPISKMRGTFRDMEGTPVMPAFHPAYLLRNMSMKRVMWEDCKKVMAKLEKLQDR